LNDAEHRWTPIRGKENEKKTKLSAQFIEIEAGTCFLPETPGLRIRAGRTALAAPHTLAGAVQDIPAAVGSRARPAALVVADSTVLAALVVADSTVLAAPVDIRVHGEEIGAFRHSGEEVLGRVDRGIVEEDREPPEEAHSQTFRGPEVAAGVDGPVGVLGGERRGGIFGRPSDRPG
jgi:hypothetical protein